MVDERCFLLEVSCSFPADYRKGEASSVENCPAWGSSPAWIVIERKTLSFVNLNTQVKYLNIYRRLKDLENTTTMHLLLVTQYWAPEQGVVQRRWQWLSQQILESGNRLSVVAPPPHYPTGKLLSDAPMDQAMAVTQVSEGFRLYRTEFHEHDQSITSRIIDQATALWSSYTQGCAAIRDSRNTDFPIDAVVCTVPAMPSAVVSYLIAVRYRLPFVVELRDAWPEIFRYMAEWHDGLRGKRKLTRWLKRVIFRTMLLASGVVLNFIINCADLVITTTNSLAALKRNKGARATVTVRNRAAANIPRPSKPVTGMSPADAASAADSDLGITAVSDAAAHDAAAHDAAVSGTDVTAGADSDSSATPEIFGASSANADSLGASPRPLRVLYAGTVGRAQGLENAMRALKIAVDAGAPVEMRIAGHGAHLNTVQNNAKRLGIPVTFLGRIPFDQMHEQYEWADSVLVHLQDWEPMHYTIPSKLFEAMWLEKHVIGSVAGEAAEIIRESGIGEVVPPMNQEALAQCFVDLAADRSRLEVYGRGKQWFDTHLHGNELSQRWINAVKTAIDTHNTRKSLADRVVRATRRGRLRQQSPLNLRKPSSLFGRNRRHN